MTTAAARKRAAVAPSRPSSRSAASIRAPFPLKPVLETLEPRLLLSADALPVAPDLLLASDASAHSAAIVAPSETTQTSAAALASGRELVFVDPRVPESEQLLKALLGEAEDDRRFEIITLDANRDGLVQVTAALKSRVQIDAVHFITHGTDGAIQLGGTLLDAKTLAANLDMVSTWGSSLKEDADLLFYGCDLAASARGRALIDWLAEITGADVAASADKTGSTAKGGDWELEYRSGAIEQRTLADASARWQGLLADIVHVQYDPGFAALDNGSYELKPGQSWGQSFQYNGGTNVDANKIELVLSQAAGAPSHTVTVSLRDSWAGPALASANLTLPATAAATPEAWYAFNIPTVTLQNGQTYVIRVDTTGADKLYLGVDSSGASPNGDLINNAGAAEGGKDAAFRVALSVPDNTVVVDTTSDLADGDTSSIAALLLDRGTDGFISLREAIIAANGTTGTDTIRFDLLTSDPNYNMGTGVWTIDIANALPVIDDAVLIDGWSQAGWTDRPLVELNGAATGPNVDGLVFTDGASEVRGLVINRFGIGGGAGNGGSGIVASGTAQLTIRGNYIGTDAAGNLAAGNGDWGIKLVSSNNVVGGVGAADRNVISGNIADGIHILGSTGNIVRGNYIGTSRDGSAGLGNRGTGVWVRNATGNTIGGTNPDERNVISGNGFSGAWQGVLLQNSDNNYILGNYIGTNALGSAALANAGPGIEINTGSDGNLVSGNVVSGNTYDGVVIWQATGNTIKSNIIGANAAGTGPLGNGDNGIWITDATDNTIGGIDPDDGNLITGNGFRLAPGTPLHGIEIDGNGSTGNAILGNRIYANAGLGIDLNLGGSAGLGDGVTPNNPDPGVGPNRLQNYPVLTAAVTTGTQVKVSGTLNSAPNTAFRIEVFASSTGDPSGNGEGERFLGSFGVTTDNLGNYSFSEFVPGIVGGGEFVSLTATNLTTSETSEFGPNATAVLNTSPAISAVADQTIDQGSALAPVAFTIGDAETSAGSLVVTATSSNQALVPDANLVLGGSGANRTIGLAPAAGQYGSTTITLSVSDGTSTTITTFVLTVNPQNALPVVANATFAVQENATNGTAVGTVSATDPDPGDSFSQIYWTDVNTRRIYRANFDGTAPQVIVTNVGGVSLQDPRGIAVDYYGGKIYWTDYGTNRIQRANLDGSGAETIISSGLTTPSHLKLDTAAGKMYWVDEGTGTIKRANLDGTVVQTLLSGLSTPKGLDLDLTAGKMYYVENGPGRIRVANLDGSGAVTLVSSLSDPWSLSIDVAGGKMYWTDPTNNRISRANLDGSSVVNTFISSTYASGVRDVIVDASRGKLYWTDEGNDRLRRANLDGTGVATVIGLDGVFGFNDYYPSGIVLGPAVPGLTYSIVGGNTDNAFAIDPVTGALSVATSAELDYETAPTFALAVEVKDAGGMTSTGTITVNLTNVNEVPAGTVTISGLVEENAALSAITSITDPDGLGPFSYQWERSTNGGATWASIVGATTASYVLGDGDVGTHLRVIASYIDGGGTLESLTSSDVGPVANVNDPGSVSITGTPAEDQSLTASVSDIEGIPGAVSYQWQRFDGASWVDIGGATANSYLLGDADVGRRVRVTASYTDGLGTPENLISADVGPIINVNDPGSVTISGTPTEDQTLAAAVSDADGIAGPISYQWERFDGASWGAIAGATGATYTLGDADFGTSVRVAATYIDDQGMSESLISAALGPIIGLNDPGSVAISGTPVEDQTLSAAVTDIDGTSGPISFQWERFDGASWSAIAGATSATYTLGDADVGSSIRVTATYLDDQGTLESLSSADVGPVANVNDIPVVTTSGGALAYTEDDPATPVDPGVTVTDVDDATLATATVRITVGYVSGEDTLSFTPVGSITGVWDVPTGTLTLTGPATLADWQTVLQSVAYLNTSGTPTAGARMIELVVNDGTANSAPATRTVNVAAVNDAPAAGDDGPYVVDEDASLSVAAAAGVLANDTDVEASPLTAVLVAGPVNAAAFTLNADGSFTYTPRADFFGTDTFTYQAFDGSASSSVATATITVNPVADNTLVVDTADDYTSASPNWGDVLSIDTLLMSKGADNRISLREAIVAANNSVNGLGPDLIRFDIPGLGVHTINVISALPTITDAVIIDGWSQPGFTVTPVIELNGAAAGQDVDGLVFTAGASEVRGLVINRFGVGGTPGDGGTGIVADGSARLLIRGNYIGTDPSGTLERGNGDYGIKLTSGSNVVGGTGTDDRNVVSGSGIDGIFVDGASGNVIQGNFIGTNATGTSALGNTEDGIWLQNASNTQIGGTASGAGNLISGNDWSGIAFTGGGSGNVIEGNLIGTNAAGTGALANLRHGVQLLGSSGTTIGGTAAGAGNVIANNGLDGVSIEAGTGHSVINNTTRANGGLGIDIGNDGVTANDPGDLLGGPNQGMNAPVIYSVLLSGGNVTITGEARAGATVQIFEAASDPSGHGEGETFLYSATVTGATPGLADATAVQFSFTFAAGSMTAGDQLTATATDSAGNTSEFSANAFASTSLPGITVTPTSGLVTTEDGATATFTVVLDSQPGADVTIALASSNTTEGTVAPAPLVFTSANWNVAQTVTVTGVADFLTDGDIAYAIVLDPATSADAGYNGLDPADVSVTNLDGANDAPVIGVPGTQIGAEDLPFVFSTGTGNAISISDADAGPTDLLEVTLTATQGLITLAGTAGLTFSVGTGTAEVTMTFTGTLAAINAALDGLTLSTALDFIGTANLAIAASDLGASGAGGPQSASESVDIDFVAVNDAPTIDLDADDSSGATGAGYQRNYTEQAGPRLIVDSVDAVLGDADSTDLAWLTVTITNADVDGTIEFLSADTAATPLISWSYNPATGVLTLNGAAPVSDYELALRTIRYENTSDAPSTNPRLISFVASDGGAPSTAAIATVTINPVNDAPVADIAAPSYAAIENSAPLALHGTGMSVADIDALPTSIVDVHLSSISGLLSATAGATGVVVSGSGSPSLTFTGTLAQINTLLAGGGGATITYAVGSDSPAPTDTLSLAIDDNGATGAGGAQWGWDSATVDLTAINDAPVNTLPSGTTPENTPLVFSAANGNQIYVTDVDAGAALVSVTLGVTNGTLSLNAAAIGGLGTLSGDGTTSITMTGTVASINAALDGLTFAPNAGFNGAALLTLSTNDQGASGSEVPPVPLSDADLATITVTPVNDAPAGTDNTVTTLQDTEYTFTLADLGFTDPDLGDAMSGVRIDALPAPAAGTLTLFGVGPVAVNDLISAADITAGNLRFTPAPTVTGSTAFTFSVRDMAGAFDPTPNIMTIDVTPAGVPGVTVTPTAGLVTTESGGTASFSVVLNTQPTADVTITLSSSNTAEGTVAPTSLVFTDVNWMTPQIVTVTGVADAVADGNVAYTIVLGPASSADLSYDAVDPADVSVTNMEANSAPTVTVPAGYSAIEGSPLTLSGPDLSVADADAGASLVTVTLSVNAGVLTVIPGATGVSAPIATGASVTLNGTIAEINALLANSLGGSVSYVTGSDSPAPSDSLTLSINDNHPSDPRSASASTSIAITAVNDAPVNTLPGGATTLEDTSLVYAGASQISITDVDAGGTPLQVTLNAWNGVMTLGGIAGLTFTSGNGTLDTSMTFTGTAAAINAALNGLTFTPDPNYWGSAYITMTTSDLGASGAGGAQTDTDLATIDVLPVNDAPDGTDTTVTAIEDTPYTFTVGNFGFNDVDSIDGDTMTAVRIDSVTLPPGATLQLSGVDIDVVGMTNNTIAVADIIAGNLVFTPVADANGANYASFTFSVADFGVPPGSLFDPVANRMTIDVAPVNDAPIITSDGGGATATFVVAENSTAVTTVTATDIDLQPLTYSISGGADAALFTINATTGALAFAPAPNFELPTDAGPDNVYNVTVRVSDGFGGSDTQALTITVTDVDDAPFALADGYATNEDSTLTVAAAGALANDYDEDGSPITATLVSGPAYGTLAFNADGSLVYTPNANFFGTDSFVYRVSDGALQSGDATVTITVNGVQDAPTAADGTASTAADTAYTFAIADFNYSDVDGDPLAQIEITVLPANGTLLLDGVAVALNQLIDAADIAAGKLTFAPPPSASGIVVDQFGFRVSDGIQFETGSHTLTIGFAPVVTAPPAPDPGGTGGGTGTAPPSGGSGGSGDTGSGDGGSTGGAGDDGTVSGGSRGGSGGAGDGGQAPAAEVAAPDKVETAAQADSGAGVAAPSAASAFASTGTGATGTAPREGGEAVGARPVEPSVEPMTVEQQAIQAMSEPAFREELDKLRRHQEEEATVETRVAGSVFAVSTSLSVGYVIWLLRGGVLLTSLLSSLPAWRIIDPLPVLSRMGGADEDEDDDSLEELVDRNSKGPDSQPGRDADADAADEAFAEGRVAPRAG